MKQKKISSGNIKKFKSKREFNIGMILFALVFLYMIVTVFLYFTSKKVSIYEVRKGSIVKDNSYTGLILREEVVVPAEKSGYLTYFITDGSKVKKDMNLLTISSKKLTTEATSSEDTSISSGSWNSVLLNVQNFSDNFTSSDFSSVYSMKTEINTELQNVNNQTMTAQLDQILSSGSGGDIQVYSAPQDGIISSHIDGFEKISIDNFKTTSLAKADLNTTEHQSGEKITAKDPAYKLITSEDWSLLVELDKNTYKSLKDTTSIKTKIDKDNETLWADLSLLTKDGKYFACLTYNTSMIRYVDDRYLDVELITEDKSGLKIPKTSVVEKEYYEVPSEYLEQGGNSSSQGVLVQTSSRSGNAAAEFQEVGTCYFSDSKDTCYIDTSLFKEGTVLVKPESQDTMTLGKTKKLKGTYNINKGYTIFKRIEILCESDEYYIINSSTASGLTNYDHIVLDGSSVKENEIIFQ